MHLSTLPRAQTQKHTGCCWAMCFFLSFKFNSTNCHSNLLFSFTFSDRTNISRYRLQAQNQKQLIPNGQVKIVTRSTCFARNIHIYFAHSKWIRIYSTKYGRIECICGWIGLYCVEEFPLIAWKILEPKKKENRNKFNRAN